jgi:hypothetical protein
MRFYDQGSLYRVAVSAEEVYQFNTRWPCSELSANHGLSFTFDKRNGDLVDHNARQFEDGSALVALSQDAQKYGEAQLKKRTPKKET